MTTTAASLPTVALFTDSDSFAGTERHILDLAVALRALGVEVEIACPLHGVLAERADDAGVPVFAVEKGRGVDLPAVFRLRRALRSGRFTLVHSHNGRTAFIAALAARLAGRGRTVTTMHFLHPARTLRRGWRAWVGRTLHHWVLRQAGRVIAISGPVRDTILARGEATPDKVQTVWNGIADPAARPLRSGEEVRAELRLGPSAPLIVCAARLEPEKAVAVLIDAMKAVAAQIPGARCVIAGEGRQRAELQARLEQAGLERVVTLAGFQPDVLSLVRASDLFVLPSAAEPFGLALVEAMALGRPVIATRAGGPIEIVEEEASGLLVPPDDAPALSAAILRLFHDRALATRLGAGGRARFERHFTAPRMAADLLALYRAVLSR